MDWRRFAVIALVIIIMFGMVVLVGIVHDSPLVIITSMLATTIAVATPLTLGALNGNAPAEQGWKTIPSWYVVGDLDLVIPPALQLSMAQRAKATISHVQGGHPSMVSHPEATVAAIEAAIAATAPK